MPLRVSGPPRVIGPSNAGDGAGAIGAGDSPVDVASYCVGSNARRASAEIRVASSSSGVNRVSAAGAA
jgi:hypothetical protein